MYCVLSVNQEALTYLYTIPTVPTAAGSAIFWISAITDIATTGGKLERNCAELPQRLITYVLEAQRARGALLTDSSAVRARAGAVRAPPGGAPRARARCRAVLT